MSSVLPVRAREGSTSTMSDPVLMLKWLKSDLDFGTENTTVIMRQPVVLLSLEVTSTCGGE